MKLLSPYDGAACADEPVGIRRQRVCGLVFAGIDNGTPMCKSMIEGIRA